MKHVFVVTAAEEQRSLAALLEARLGLAAGEAARWIAAGAVAVDDSRERRSELRLRAGQRVVARRPEEEQAPAPALELAYRDADLAVVDKPGGLPSTTPRAGGTCLEDLVRASLGGEARLLHRLDREASGLLVVTLGPAARRALAPALAEHRLTRRYLALAQGGVPEELVLSSALAASGGRTRSSSDPRAREAVTRARLLRGGERVSLLEVTLETGRTHQIRAHLAEAGHPLLGDRLYAHEQALAAADRLCLHASMLSLTHPQTSERMRFECPAPF